jgi:UDP-N-acetylmuramoyl-tripeptide--D-alanyl-D-alanine ligase
VTGSNGKTTVTQMVAAILRAWLGERAGHRRQPEQPHRRAADLLLRLRAHHRAAVVELGMNHPGEIALLARLAAPTVALVNNAQREHQEFMASVEAVAQENGSVISALPADGTAVFPADDAFAPLWRELAGTRRVMSFATGAADVTARPSGMPTRPLDLTLHTPGRATWPPRCAMPGQHNLRNALAAAACALAAGAPLAAVAQGLADFEPVKGRSQVLANCCVRPARHAGRRQLQRQPRLGAGRHRRAGRLPGPRWLLLGDMGEVGARARSSTPRWGHGAARGIEHVWGRCHGALCAAPGRGAPLCRHMAALLAALPAGARGGGGAGEGIALHEDGTGGAGCCGSASGGAHAA